MKSGASGEIDGTQYDEEYYRTGCGEQPYERSEAWLAEFARIADDLIRIFRPRTVLDAGCALGMLVEALWDRGIESQGIDVSRFAIDNVRPDMRPHCTVGSIAEPLGGPYDIVTCIEVLEHIPANQMSAVLDRLVEASDIVVFSSTPLDFDEPTHVNVRPPIAWLREFADRGFAPDLTLDAGFISPQAFVVRKAPQRVSDAVLELFANRIRLACRVRELARERAANDDEFRRLRDERARFSDNVLALEQHYAAMSAECASLLAQLESARSEAQLMATAAVERDELRATVAVLKAETAGLQSRLKELETSHIQLIDQNDAVTDRTRELIERYRIDLQRQIGTLDTAISTIHSSVFWRAKTRVRRRDQR